MPVFGSKYCSTWKFCEGEKRDSAEGRLHRGALQGSFPGYIVGDGKELSVGDGKELLVWTQLLQGRAWLVGKKCASKHLRLMLRDQRLDLWCKPAKVQF